MSVLVVAAHPDDEVLGCGGTMARLVQEGETVAVAILGEGITSRYNARDATDPQLLDELRSSSRRALERLGIEDVQLLELPDNRFDTVPMLDVVKIVEELIRNVGPDTIYTHHSGDLNIDHGVVHRAVLTATRPVEGAAVKTIYAFEVPSSTEWAFGQFASVFRPNVYVDIASTLDAKLDAMELYGSEARPAPHPRSRASLEALARTRGSASGLLAAEAFELVRDVRLSARTDA